MSRHLALLVRSTLVVAALGASSVAAAQDDAQTGSTPATADTSDTADTADTADASDTADTSDSYDGYDTCAAEIESLNAEIDALHAEGFHVHGTPLVIPLHRDAIGVDAGDTGPRVVVIADESADLASDFVCLQTCECGTCLTFGTQGRLINGTSGGSYSGSGSCTCSGGETVPYSGCANAGTAIWSGGGTWAGSGSAVGQGCADSACAAAGQGSCNLSGLIQQIDYYSQSAAAHNDRGNP